jgi:[ribosomal protein S5]-alanine N-acetyltransferase
VPKVRGLARALEVGSRVFLRHPTARDGAELQTLRRKSRAFLAPWEPKIPGQFGAPYVQRFLSTADQDRSQRFLVCRSGDGAMVGQIGLGEIARGAFQSCYMGYWLGKPFTGQGYMTEAVRLALRHAFTGLELHRVEANIIPGNAASIAVVKRCGFRLEGYSPRYLQIRGRFRDHERWALTLEDWRSEGR